jgi:hypothetical protein
MRIASAKQRCAPEQMGSRIVVAACCAAGTISYFLFSYDVLYRRFAALANAYVVTYFIMFVTLGFVSASWKNLSTVLSLIFVSWFCSAASYLVICMFFFGAHNRPAHATDLLLVSIFFPFLAAGGWIPAIIAASLFALTAMRRPRL